MTVELKLRPGLGQLIAANRDYETSNSPAVLLEQPAQVRVITTGSYDDEDYWGHSVHDESFHLAIPRMLYVVFPGYRAYEAYAIKEPADLTNGLKQPLYCCPLPSLHSWNKQIHVHEYCSNEYPTEGEELFEGSLTLAVRSSRSRLALSAIEHVQGFFDSLFPYYTPSVRTSEFFSEAFAWFQQFTEENLFEPEEDDYSPVNMPEILRVWQENVSLTLAAKIPWAQTPVTTLKELLQRRDLISLKKKG